MVWWAAKESIYVSADKADNIAGVITAFILCLTLLFRPLRVIADKFNVLQMGMIAGERVFKVLDNEDVTNNSGTYAPKVVNGKINFDNVSFAYVPDRYVLKNINFEIEPGKTLAIVGHTGSGKTSIINLVNRLYKVNSGKILIDDINIEDYELNHLRKSISVVLQDVFLFSGSIFDNVTLHNPDMTLEEVQAAAKLIGLHDFIMKLPENYHYKVRERGATLSLGQRQLISFLRALLYNPSILILDEATSSVDSESEVLIQEAIDKLITGRTSIIIAHRLSTIRKADTIIVLDKGEIMEMGSHTELMEQKGFYFQLHNMQFKEQVLGEKV